MLCLRLCVFFETSISQLISRRAATGTKKTSNLFSADEVWSLKTSYHLLHSTISNEDVSARL